MIAVSSWQRKSGQPSLYRDGNGELLQSVTNLDKVQARCLQDHVLRADPTFGGGRRLRLAMDVGCKEG